VLQTIFGFKKWHERETENSQKTVHYFIFYMLRCKTRRMSWDGYVGQFGKNVYQIFDAKILGNRS
jgi:hypothetical protein